MQRIVDLELWTRPRSQAVPLEGACVAEACRAGTGLSSEVVLGLSFLPDRTDVENLRHAFSAGETTPEAFMNFCSQHALDEDFNSEPSAAKFLAYLWGQPLAWLHFPANSSGRQMAEAVSLWAEQAGFVVVAGQGEPPLSQVEILARWPQ